MTKNPKFRQERLKMISRLYETTLLELHIPSDKSLGYFHIGPYGTMRKPGPGKQKFN